MTDSKWWNNTAEGKQEYDRLWAKFVPSMGVPNDDSGAVLVCASKIMYDIFNNGGCNLGSNYGDYVETLEGYGIDMNWLREKVDFNLVLVGDCLDAEFIDGCGDDVDSMMEQALDVAISCETKNSNKVIHELEWIRDRVYREIGGLIRTIESRHDDDCDPSDWSDSDTHYAEWLEVCLPRLMKEALECGGCSQEQLSKAGGAA
jgi:hypothetical protein